jgi:GNAT superfamily N-acetyltransferase
MTSASRRRPRKKRSSAPVTVRKATARDLEILVQHRRGMFEGMGIGDPASLARHDRDFRRWVVPRLRRAEYVGFIAEVAKQPVAGGSVWLQERQPRPGFAGGRLPYLLSVYTDPRFRGRGLATRITKAAMEWCRAQGYGSITLHASKAGRSVYERLGWQRTWEMGVSLSAREARRARLARPSIARG